MAGSYVKKLAGSLALSACFLWTALFVPTAESKVYEKGGNFIDVEVPAKNALVRCFHLNQKEKRSLVAFYLLDGSVRHEFFYRVLEDKRDCIALERTYKKLIDSAPTVRIVGMHAHTPSIEKLNDLPSSIPKVFSERMLSIHWTFVRLQTKNGCKAYFPDDCELPKNYWAGLDPLRCNKSHPLQNESCEIERAIDGVWPD